MKGHAERLNDMRGVDTLRVRRFVECVSGRVPELQIVAKATLLLFGQIGNSDLDLNARRIIATIIYPRSVIRLRLGRSCLTIFGRFSFLSDLGNILTQMEIMLVNRRGSIESVWAECEVECLKDRRLSCIVVANQHCVLGQMEKGGLDTAEVIDCYSTYPQESTP
jgi:hypothetical protein